MNPAPQEKTIPTLLKDIQGSNAPSQVPPRGLVDPKLVDRVTFYTSLFCVFFITAALISAIWDLADQVFAFRCVGSMLVLVVALFAFRAINAHFE